MRAHLAGAEVVWPDAALSSVYADLRTWCVHNGHGLGQKEHEADRWVAATALHLGVPLIAHDRVFVGVDGLGLLTRL
jgi:predicted nucleic acid-binding protein